MINEAILDEIQNEFLNGDVVNLRAEWNHYKYKKLFVPRVTEIIHSCSLDTDGLVRWANALGFKGINADYSRDKAALIGQETHKAIEDYLMHKSYPKFDTPMEYKVKEAISNGISGFISFWENFRYKDLVTDISMEQTLVTPYYGGTYDLLITLADGRKYLYDFKTTNKVQYSHFIQLGAYKYTLNNYFNTDLAGCAILHISKKKPSCSEYMLEFNEQDNVRFINQCERTFISMLYTYYNSTVVKLMYDEIKN